jgi:hypothetical protein
MLHRPRERVSSVLAFNRLSFGGSLIGSIEETQEILDFCAAHGIAPQVETIPIDEINSAFDKVVAAKVRYRYVIDNATLARWRAPEGLAHEDEIEGDDQTHDRNGDGADYDRAA